MGKERNYIDEYFKEGLGNLNLMPPADVWKNIEKELDRKRRIGIIALWSGLAAGLAMFVGVGGYYFFNNKQSNQIVAHVGKINETHNSKVNEHVLASSSKLASMHKAPLTAVFVEKQIISSETKPSLGRIDSTNETNLIATSENSVFTTDKTNHFILAGGGDANSDSMNNLKGKDNVSLLTPKSFVFTESPRIRLVIPQIVSNNNSTILLSYSDFIAPELPKFNHWSIEGQVAPQYSYRNIPSVASNTLSKKQFNSQEEGLVAYAGGIKVSYETTSRLSFQIGVVYSVIGQTLKDVYAIAQPYAVNTSILEGGPSKVGNNSLGTIPKQGPSSESIIYVKSALADVVNNNLLLINSADKTNVINASTSDVRIVQQQKYIEIPLLARYILFDKKIGIHVVGGISTNVLVDNSVLVKSGSSTNNIGETGNLRFLNYNSNLGLGFNYKLWKKTTLTLEPTFKYYLNSISDKGDINYHPYSFGIFTGVRYKF